MINGELLKNKIFERGYTIENFSDALNVRNNILIMKINSNIEFTVGEVSKISLLLRLNYNEIEDIFFST